MFNQCVSLQAQLNPNDPSASPLITQDDECEIPPSSINIALLPPLILLILLHKAAAKSLICVRRITQESECPPCLDRGH